jgi:hypothetical protein
MSQKKTTRAEADDVSEAGFVSRWSRLKHAAAKDAETTAIENTAAHHAAVENSGLEAKQASSARILTDEDMPVIESLTPESDYSDFFSPGVSDALRKLALRKLFQGEAFNIRDGLDDYDDDYTRFEKLGDIVTADMRHQLELEAQRKVERLLQHDDQSSDADGIHDVATKSGHDESVDQNIIITAKESVQPDERLPGGENGQEAEDGTIGGEKAKKLVSES